MSIFDLTSTNQIQSLKIACIMDEFSYETFRYDCEMMQLTPGDWENELRSFQPELLLVESAWRGKDNLWANKVFSTSSALPNIVGWCKERAIPTAFWNKEDPVNFESFTHGMGVTQLFDYIFTTDVDSICRYKKLLQHNKIYLLPFTVQPKLHNPIEEYQREDGVCFAGSYYCKYPQRAADFKIIYDSILKYKPITIYDRNHTRGDKQFQFPDHYTPSIKGFLPFSEIGKGYKGYNYGITMNSVTRSQTMFARRALELIACNTSVISNYSRSLQLFFGHGITMLGDIDDFNTQLQTLFEVSSARNKLKYQLLTHVMNELSSEAGLRLVVEIIIGRKLQDVPLSVCCIAVPHTTQVVAQLYQQFNQQTHTSKTLLIIGNKQIAALGAEFPAVRFASMEEFADNAATLLQEFDLVAKFDADDYYAPQYLADSVLAQSYKPETITCKTPYFQADAAGHISLSGKNKPYLWSNNFLTATAVFPTTQLNQATLLDLLNYEVWPHPQQALALDIYNYCQGGAQSTVDNPEIAVAADHTSFATMQQLHEMALDTSDEFKQVYDLVKFDSEKLLKSFTQKKPNIDLNLDLWPIHLSSRLDPEKHDYINSDILLDLKDLLQDGKLKFWLNASYRCDLLLDIWFYDTEGKDVGRAIYPPNSAITYLPPVEAVKVKFALRIKGPGEATLSEFLTGTRVFLPDAIRNLHPTLFITDSVKALPSVNEMIAQGNPDIFIFANDIDYEYGKYGESATITGGPLLFEALLCGASFEKLVCTNAKLQQQLIATHPSVAALFSN